TRLTESQLAASARAAIASISPDAVMNQWRPLQQLIDKAPLPRRFGVLMLSGFTSFALLLAALGIYALISYGVTQRTQEIGIRLALGASASEVRAIIMRGTLVLAGSGIVIGVVAAAFVAPSLNGMLFGVVVTDPVSFGGSLGLLVVVAIAAGHFPARRASRVDPSVALRDS